ncbi:MAG: putative manganese transporter [Candidatus Zixiibacteriota bacterium]
MIEHILHIANHAVMVTGFVFAMMVITDFINVVTNGGAQKWTSKSKFKQYFVGSLLGAIPGCTGAFMSVTMYCHRFIGFGAITAAMIATAGDASFVMLAMFPGQALLIFLIIFILGILLAPLAERFGKLLKVNPAKTCNEKGIHNHIEPKFLWSIKAIIDDLKEFHFSKYLLLFINIVFLLLIISGMVGPHEWNWGRITMAVLLSFMVIIVLLSPEHFIEEHIWYHIIRRHLWKIFLWTLLAMFTVHFATEHYDLQGLIQGNQVWILLFAGLIGILPDSAPHIMFVVLFSKGLIPFSVLLTSSIVQDGHGMLPLLSMSLKDSIYIKIFNFLTGITIGYIVLAFGY